jgi:hypothetical protein
MGKSAKPELLELTLELTEDEWLEWFIRLAQYKGNTRNQLLALEAMRTKFTRDFSSHMQPLKTGKVYKRKVKKKGKHR